MCVAPVYGMLDAPRLDAPVALAAPVTTGAQRVAARLVVPLFALTLFVSSFLMFAVEPMAARQLLPVLGGVPMVWNGCVVFFQAVLLLGYGAAHVLTRWCGSALRLVVFAAIAVVPLMYLRLSVDGASAAQATQAPLLWLLTSLATTVGPPFLVLAVSASVLQSSLASSRHESASDPYFLYMASNVGSLTALLAYPTVIEPWLGLAAQGHVWSGAYAAFVGLLVLCAAVAWIALETAPPPSGAAAAPTDAEASVTWRQRLRWGVLAAVPSSLMLGVTTALTTDIAPIPLLWIVPLAIYLLTFVIAFSRLGEAATRLAQRFLPAALLALAVVTTLWAAMAVAAALVLHLVLFFAVAMFCHGQLAQERPAASRLTEFYFWIALGGVIGGLFNTLAAPLLFSRLLEYPLVLALAALLRRSGTPRRFEAVDATLLALAAALVVTLLLAPALLTPQVLLAAFISLAIMALARRDQRWTLAGVAGMFLVAAPFIGGSHETVLAATRTFFGAYEVSVDTAEHRHQLAHGTTLHGVQSLDPASRQEPLSYYHRTGPIGQVMSGVPRLSQPGRVAAIGLGVGTLAAYARPGQQWTFYEIDPAIERLARNPSYFTFLARCGAACRVVIGDARLSMAADRGPGFALIVLDAFSSDAIPIHLLTQEAIGVYLTHLAPGGVLAVHISNRHLTLAPIVGRLAEANGLTVLEQFQKRRRSQPWPDGKNESHWMVLARAGADLAGLRASGAWAPPAVPAATPLWTDDHSNILGVLRLTRH